jgi:hypothetical protein
MHNRGEHQRMIMKVYSVLLAVLLSASMALAETMLNVPADPTAQHVLVKKGGTGAARLIVTKRVGLEGISFAKRLYNCKENTVKFLGSAGSVEEIAGSKPDGKMETIAAGSIDFFIGAEACK